VRTDRDTPNLQRRKFITSSPLSSTTPFRNQLLIITIYIHTAHSCSYTHFISPNNPSHAIVNEDLSPTSTVSTLQQQNRNQTLCSATILGKLFLEWIVSLNPNGLSPNNRPSYSSSLFLKTSCASPRRGSSSPFPFRLLALRPGVGNTMPSRNAMATGGGCCIGSSRDSFSEAEGRCGGYSRLVDVVVAASDSSREWRGDLALSAGRGQARRGGVWR
jgi:hypothetical protein